jgi:hypothetical protein
MYNLPSEQEAKIKEAIQEFNEIGALNIYEPCDCGNQIRHNNGGNYHDEIYLRRDSGQIFVKYETTCELVPRAQWKKCDDWEAIIRQKADWL